MKFKELREATLSKTQIKKVHDKADDLPKNDFIKRYGKEGDSVRFATATKMVKKELGIEDYEEGFKSDAQRRAAFASGYKEKGKKKNEGGPGSGPRHKEVTLTRNGKTKTVKGVAAKIFTDAGWKLKEAVDSDYVGVSSSSIEYKQGKQAAKDGKKYDDNPYKSGNREMNIKRLNWSSGHNNFREELDDKDKETIKPIIKQLQKSVKAHDKQAKQLQKDIQDEVELDEGPKFDIKKIDNGGIYTHGLYYNGNLVSGLESTDKKYVEKIKKMVTKNLTMGEEVELTEGRVMIAVDKKTRKKWQFSDGMIVKHNGKQYKTEGVTTQQVLELTASFGTLKLGKKDIEAGFAKGNFSVVDDGSVYQPWKNDFEPEGEKELTEAVSDAYVKQIARMTDRNDHFGARFELARLMKDKQLMGFYDSLEKMHTTLPRGVIGNDAITIRQRLERLLRDRLKSKLKADADKLIDAL